MGDETFIDMYEIAEDIENLFNDDMDEESVGKKEKEEAKDSNNADVDDELINVMIGNDVKSDDNTEKVEDSNDDIEDESNDCKNAGNKLVDPEIKDPNIDAAKTKGEDDDLNEEVSAEKGKENTTEANPKDERKASEKCKNTS